MAGRKSLYFRNVQPHLDWIDKQLNNGATELQCATALNVAYSSWNNYKTQFKEFYDLCNKPRVSLVEKLRGKLVDRAMGMKVEDKKTYIKVVDGTETKYTEITVRELPPDVTAIFGSLNIYDPDYVKDRKQHEQKERELALREQLAKKDLW